MGRSRPRPTPVHTADHLTNAELDSQRNALARKPDSLLQYPLDCQPKDRHSLSGLTDAQPNPSHMLGWWNAKHSESLAPPQHYPCSCFLLFLSLLTAHRPASLPAIPCQQGNQGSPIAADKSLREKKSPLGLYTSAVVPGAALCGLEPSALGDLAQPSHACRPPRSSLEHRRPQSRPPRPSPERCHAQSLPPRP